MAEVRDFTSYASRMNKGMPQQEFPEEEPSYKERIRNHRIVVVFRTVAIAVAVVLFVALVYIGWRDKEYSEAVITPGQSVTNGIDARLISLRENVVQFSKDGISCINPSGAVVWNQTYEMQNPIAHTCGDVVAVGDYNGHTIYVSNVSGAMGEVDTNLPIRDFCVSSQGVVAAVLDGTNVTWIYLYDAKGNTLANFKTTMKDSGYPIAVSISPNGELLCVSYVYPEDGAVKTSVAFFNFGSVGQNSIDNYASGYDYPGVVVPFVQFMNSNSSFAVSDDRIMFYSGDQKPVSQAEIFTGDEEIRSVYFNDTYVGAVYPNSTSDGAYKLKVYNNRGEEVLTTFFDMEYSEVIFNNKQIIIYNEDECMIQDMNGHIKYQGSFETPVRILVPTSVRSRFTLVTTDNVQTMNLK
ncbi:MAG: DUF5711 family protein [Butyrivibrio sp.]|nr:DUF5711 family protein [Butyrivibrio sp.]